MYFPLIQILVISSCSRLGPCSSYSSCSTFKFGHFSCQLFTRDKDSQRYIPEMVKNWEHWRRIHRVLGSSWIQAILTLVSTLGTLGLGDTWVIMGDCLFRNHHLGPCRAPIFRRSMTHQHIISLVIFQREKSRLWLVTPSLIYVIGDYGWQNHHFIVQHCPTISFLWMACWLNPTVPRQRRSTSVHQTTRETRCLGPRFRQLSW